MSYEFDEKSSKTGFFVQLGFSTDGLITGRHAKYVIDSVWILFCRFRFLAVKSKKVLFFFLMCASTVFYERK